MRLLLVLLGGALGSGARYGVELWAATRFGAASFLIGLLATLASELGRIGPDGRVFLPVGVLGVFTTFSNFSLETVRLMGHNEPARALANILVCLFLALGATLLGVAAGRMLGR